MRPGVESTNRTRPQRLLCFFAVLFTSGWTGIGCGRTKLGDFPSVAGTGGNSGTSKQDGGPSDGRREGGPFAGTGGGLGARPDAAGTGGLGVGGVATGGTGPGRGGAAGTGGLGAGGAATGGTCPGGGGAAGVAAQPLWRDSPSPLCSNTEQYPGDQVGDVWSDERGIFILTTGWTSGTTIFANAGKGWQTTMTWPSWTCFLAGGLRGFVDGPLVVYEGASHDRGVCGSRTCSIQFVDQNVASCSSAASMTADVAVVSANLAFSLSRDRVLQFDGNYWTQLGGPLPSAGTGSARAMWANASTIAIAADAGRIYIIQPGQDPVVQTGLPDADFTAIWGFGASDIWAGNAEGQLYHYDGANWSLKASLQDSSQGSSAAPGIVKLWGSEGALFMISSATLGKWDGASITVLDSLDGVSQYYQGLWGNSPSEVFVTLFDGESTASACGPFKARWWNGSVVAPL